MPHLVVDFHDRVLWRDMFDRNVLNFNDAQQILFEYFPLELRTNTFLQRGNEIHKNDDYNVYQLLKYIDLKYSKEIYMFMKGEWYYLKVENLDDENNVFKPLKEFYLPTATDIEAFKKIFRNV